MTDAVHRPELADATDPRALAHAAELLRTGGLIAFPTETVYGLGADATDARAVARIYEAKGRPSFNPLISHCADAEAAFAEGRFDARARALATRFWPGPLTLVVRRAPDSRIADLTAAGLDTLALRVPGSETARRLLTLTGRPVAAPSANRSGSISPTTARHVADSLGNAVDLILDGGPCPVGVESTVIDLSGDRPALLRPGGLPREELEAAAGPLRDPASDPDAPTSPGQLASHYAPNARLRLNATDPSADEALLAFGPEVPGGAKATLNLSPTGDLREAAANLFAQLHALDRPDIRGIAAMPVPETGLGAAINDRLRRAAAPRGYD
ncbi:L-threonylcarbamoyladenylate synthase [Rhodovibrio salinarum]|uniref:Threonylcarbamoyl-AMP synthase n=1 Tax=Rhodovibrio salinarum TaxID=1087 RepID=A0A934QLM3_9PROT|nr:L-threonylcarbamoyladenylate synthase [Rhodovibrio salinarum]MBK1698769.1 L-threonylcarbamoyladenylate synthase [Rhodovibrio salinarum]